MEVKIECPMCGHMNLARQPTRGVSLACENCGYNIIIVEEDDDDFEQDDDFF